MKKLVSILLVLALAVVMSFGTCAVFADKTPQKTKEKAKAHSNNSNAKNEKSREE